MADNRKYYYLKLKESYFDDDAILFTGENFRKETAQAKLNGLKELLK